MDLFYEHKINDILLYAFFGFECCKMETLSFLKLYVDTHLHTTVP